MGSTIGFLKIICSLCLFILNLFFDDHKMGILNSIYDYCNITDNKIKKERCDVLTISIKEQISWFVKNITSKLKKSPIIYYNRTKNKKEMCKLVNKTFEAEMDIST